MTYLSGEGVEGEKVLARTHEYRSPPSHHSEMKFVLSESIDCMFHNKVLCSEFRLQLQCDVSIYKIATMLVIVFDHQESWLPSRK